MARERFLFLAAALAGCVCLGQSPAPTFTYALHGANKDVFASDLYVAQDGSLLVIWWRPKAPEGKNAEIRRITKWDTPSPQEQELDLGVGAPDKLGQLGVTEWMMDPGANYLILRTAVDNIGWQLSFSKQDEAPPSPRAAVNVIDLKKFALISHSAVSDPVLAAGDIGFNKDGVLIETGMVEHSLSQKDGAVWNTGSFEVRTLSVPGLMPKVLCRFTRSVKQGNFWPDEASRPLLREQEQQADAVCDAGLRPLGYSSVSDLESKLIGVDKATIALKVNPLQGPAYEKVSKNDRYRCPAGKLSLDERYVLFQCEAQQWEPYTLKVHFRGETVFTVADGRLVMGVSLPPSDSYVSGAVAASGGQNYLAVLRDGVKLEVYRLP